MNSSAVNNNQVTVNVLPSNPFTNCKRAINFDPANTIVSNLPDELATLIFSKMALEQVKVVLDSTNTAMGADRYTLYRNLVGLKSSLTGAELEKFQRLLSTEGETPIPIEAETTPSRMGFLVQLVLSAVEYVTGNTNQSTEPLKSWAECLKDKPISFSQLKHLDLSDSTGISDADLIALTNDCKNLTKLILPGAFPSDEMMAMLRTNCPEAAIYPSAMTEHEWAHPAEFIRKLPPPPKEIEDFINSARPIWPGKTSAQAHMVMPKVSRVIANIDGRPEIVPWTLKNINELDRATGGVGCSDIALMNFQFVGSSEVGFEWIVFTKDVLPGSRNLNYSNHKQLVEHWGYQMPGFLDAIQCMLWENRISGNGIYNNDYPWTYTRCKEMFENRLPFFIGWNTQTGVSIHFRSTKCIHDSIGVGGLRKFSIK